MEEKLTLHVVFFARKLPVIVVFVARTKISIHMQISHVVRTKRRAYSN